MSPFARLSEEQREQIREIYEKNYIKLYQKAYGILNHWEDAEDVLHDSIIKLMEHYEKYQYLDNEKMTALCKTIVKNRSIDILRQRCRFVDRKEIETLWDKTEPDVYSHIKKKYEEEWFREELEILSQPLQEVVVLKYCYEYRNPEIAKILGVTLRTVEMRLERAKQRIRRETED